MNRCHNIKTGTSNNNVFGGIANWKTSEIGIIRLDVEGDFITNWYIMAHTFPRSLYGDKGHTIA